MFDKIIISVVSALATALVLWLGGKLVAVPEAVVIPTGTVSAFALDKCPGGWDRYGQADGRSVIGIPEGSKVAVGQQSGSSQLEVQSDNLPEHQHDTALGLLPSYSGGWGHGAGKIAIAGASAGGPFITALTSPVGRKQPVPLKIEPPTVSLKYCVKK